jgi:hypothetical protein
MNDEGAFPRLRVIPSDKFLALSEDSQDPTVLTTVVIYQGKYRPTPTGGERRYFKAVDKFQFIYFDEDKRDITPMFTSVDNPDGLNPYGALPYVYINKSEDRIMPIQDTDTKRMAVLIPTLLADTNYASMFQAFSILYGIDVSDQGLKMAPNAFWTFKTEPGSDAKPEIGSIKPDMNVEGSLSLIASQLAFWLNSRGIRPGAIGEITASNFSSGISKMIDEMDTVDDRKTQVPHFKMAEESLWDLVLHKMHPVWAASGMLENKTPFAPTSFVTVTFPDQVPLSRRGELVKEAAEEINAGLTTNRRAIQRINPELSEEEVDNLMEEIGGVNEVEVEGDPSTLATTNAAGGTVQQLSLNGAQVESLVQIIERVSTGLLPKESAKAIIKAAFAVPDEQINSILDSIVVGSKSVEETSLSPGNAQKSSFPTA